MQGDLGELDESNPSGATQCDCCHRQLPVLALKRRRAIPIQFWDPPRFIGDDVYCERCRYPLQPPFVRRAK